MINFNSTMSDYKKVLAKAASSQKNADEEIKMNTDGNLQSQPKSANINKHPLEESKQKQKKQQPLIVDEEEDEDEEDEDINDNLQAPSGKRNKKLLDHVPSQAEYTSDSEIRSRKKKPSLVQKIDYSLSSEEGPLKNEEMINTNQMYDNVNFKFQIEEEKKSGGFSNTMQQPTKR